MLGSSQHVKRITGLPNPFESYLLAASVIQGFLIATGGARSEVVSAALDGRPWLRFVWAALMGLGGVAALAGLYWRGNPFNAVEIKRVGLVGVGCGTLVYGVALMLVGKAGYVAGLTAVAFALASFWRIGQVTQLLKQARRDVEELRARGIT
jgi:hypothetical protein